MKRLILFAVLALVPSLASAQLPEPIEGLQNPLVIAGANYLNDKPADGSSQVRFLLTANLAGIKPISDLPLYIGGLGIDIRTLPELGGLGQSNGAGLSLPIVTYAFAGSQAVVQVGYSFGFGEEGEKASGVYAGLGFSLTPPQAGSGSLKAKREAKAKAKAKKALLDQGPPAPAS